MTAIPPEEIERVNRLAAEALENQDCRTAEIVDLLSNLPQFPEQLANPTLALKIRNRIVWYLQDSTHPDRSDQDIANMIVEYGT